VSVKEFKQSVHKWRNRSTWLPKSEVSISTHYEDMKGITKCQNWGSFG